jgi:hypothetical protein
VGTFPKGSDAKSELKKPGQSI